MTKCTLECVARQCHPMVSLFGGISGSITTTSLRYAKKPPSKSLPQRLLGNRNFVMSFPKIPVLADRLRLFLPARWRVGNLQLRRAFVGRADHRLRPDNNLAV